MDNGTVDQVHEKDEAGALEPGIIGIDQACSPRSDLSDKGVHSEPASADSQHSTSRRRYQRGGRKKNKKSGRLQSVSEFEVPRDRSKEENVQDDPESDDGNWNSEDYDAEELEKARSARPSSMNKKQSPNSTPKPDTGIRAFNMQRATSSDRRRPIGITVERPNERASSTGKKEHKEKKKKNKKSMIKKQESSESEESEEEEEETHEEKKKKNQKNKKNMKTKKQGSDEKSEEDETSKRKPVSIRLDLNLELEILLRAKVKGDITITFLE